MVPVGMGEDQRAVATILGHKPVPQSPDAGAGVDDHDFVVLRADLDARGISAVAQIFLARYRYGASGAPTADQHAFPPFC